MPRREYAARMKCGHPGCEEIAHYTFDRRADQSAHLKRYWPDKYRCTRHTQPDEVLMPENLKRELTMQIFDEPHGRFWGTTRAWNGVVYGPGFKAYAKDFPPGTMLRVTAEIILPDPTPMKE